jgi:CHASE3 domain sensor protein
MPPRTGVLSTLGSYIRNGGLASLGAQVMIVAAVLLLAAILLLGVNQTKLQQSFAESERADNTMLELTTVESRLIGMQAGLRGYALTGIEFYRLRQKPNIHFAKLAMAQLAASLRDDETQSRRYRELVPLFQRHVAGYERMATAEHRGEIASYLAVQPSPDATDTMRGKIWELLLTERTKRMRHQKAMADEARYSFWLAIGIVVLATLAGSLGFVVSIAGGRAQRAGGAAKEPAA